MNTIKSQMKDLKYYNKKYRDGVPEITDEQYDALLDHLESQMKSNEFKVFRGSLCESGGEVKLSHIAGSLKKCTYGTDQLEKFINNHDYNMFFISAKLDGMGFISTYVNGMLVSVTTTGDGETAEDITHNAKHIMPLIDGDGVLIVRGELVIPVEKSENMGFKNARNGVVGIMKRKDVNMDHIKNVDVVAYQIMNNDNLTYPEQYDLLEKMGFLVPDNIVMEVESEFTSEDEESLKELLEEWRSKDYLVDGLVINNVNYLPENVKLPDHTVAFKVNTESATTLVTGMDIIPSKDGYLCGVAQLSPVELSGTTVSRATIYNYQYVVENGIGPGSEVIVTKAGEIIPKILEVLTPVDIQTSLYWDRCPVCGEATIDSGVHRQCPNVNCPSKSIGFVHSFLRKCKVKGASEISLTKWGINSITDLLEFQPEGKNAVKFYNDFENKVFSIPSPELLGKFNWSGVGEKIIKKYIDEFGLEGFITKALNKEEIENHPKGCGKKFWAVIVKSFPKVYKEYQNITNDSRYVVPVKEVEEVVDNDNMKLFGDSFCLTGTLSRKRKEIEEEIVKYGGVIKNVSKNLDYLVAGEKSGSKLTKAKKLGVTIINEHDLMELLNG